MIRVQEHPIHCIDGKCIYMSKKSLEHRPFSNNYENVYGETDSYRRLEHLGTPIFVVQTEQHLEPSVQEITNSSKYDPISDEMFDELFTKVEKKTKTRDNSNKKTKSTRETKKKRKGKKNP